MTHTKSKKGFTLIEIMIVVVIIGLLAAMAIPAFNKVREQSREKTVLNNLRQIAAAGQQYILENGAQTVGYASLEDVYFSTIAAVAGEDYSGVTVSADGVTISVGMNGGSGPTVVFTY